MKYGDILLTKDRPLAIKGVRKLCNAHAPRAIVMYNGATCPLCDALVNTAPRRVSYTDEDGALSSVMFRS